MSSAPRIIHHPRRHPFVDRVARHHDDAPDVGDVWNVDSLVAGRVDGVHLHFDFEHIAPDDMWAWCAALKRAGIRLIHTVHHIDDPHLVDQRDHHLRLAALVHHADELATLTPTACAEIGARWGRHPRIVAHPRMLPDARIEAIRRRGPHLRPVLVWVGAPRPNIDVDVIVDVVERVTHPVEVVARLGGWEALPEAVRQRIVDAVFRSASSELVITGRPDDDALVDLIAQRPAQVLPYAWGTHSELVRLASELDVPALVPTVGCHADQGALVAPADELADLVADVAAAASGRVAVG